MNKLKYRRISGDSAGSVTCCCGFFTLREGASVIAILCLVGAVINAAGAIRAMFHLHDFHYLMNNLRDFFAQAYSDHQINGDDYQWLNEQSKQLERTLPTVLIINIALVTAKLVINAFLGAGVAKKRPSYMLPFLIVTMMEMIAQALIVVAISSLLSILTKGMIGLIVMLICLPFLALGFYFWYVVFKYYLLLIRHQRNA